MAASLGFSSLNMDKISIGLKTNKNNNYYNNSNNVIHKSTGNCME